MEKALNACSRSTRRASPKSKSRRQAQLAEPSSITCAGGKANRRQRFASSYSRKLIVKRLKRYNAKRRRDELACRAVALAKACLVPLFNGLSPDHTKCPIDGTRQA